MKQLYQTLKSFFITRPLNHPEYSDFLMDKTLAGSENHICFMDAYQLQQMNLLKQIGIKAYSSQDEF